MLLTFLSLLTYICQLSGMVYLPHVLISSTFDTVIWGDPKPSLTSNDISCTGGTKLPSPGPWMDYRKNYDQSGYFIDWQFLAHTWQFWAKEFTLYILTNTTNSSYCIPLQSWWYINNFTISSLNIIHIIWYSDNKLKLGFPPNLGKMDRILTPSTNYLKTWTYQIKVCFGHSIFF